VTDVLVDAGAMIEYHGDGVTAVFGVPTVQFDDVMADRLGGAHFRVGFGINSRTVTAGNLGTVRRLKYSVIGDAVNTAARIDGMTKNAPFDILIADATLVLLSEEPGDLVEHGTLPIVAGPSRCVCGRSCALRRTISSAFGDGPHLFVDLVGEQRDDVDRFEVLHDLRHAGCASDDR
jgi:class 3 adenylate cyclase